MLENHFNNLAKHGKDVNIIFYLAYEVVEKILKNGGVKLIINILRDRFNNKISKSLIPILLIFIVIPSTVMSQNITINPNINSELQPWVAFLSVAPDPNGTGSVNWTGSQNNENVMNGSGSAQVQLEPPIFVNASSGFRQCIELPNAPVSVMVAKYGTHVLIPQTGNPMSGVANASIEVRFFSDANCSSFIPGAGGNQGRIFDGILSDTDWYIIEDNSLSMPNDSIVASSAEVRGFLRATEASSEEYVAYFDHVFLALNGNLPVELIQFSVD
ncbi:MAG: hypothetical protein AB8B80_09190 [Marinicellaceae bacterium]